MKVTLIDFTGKGRPHDQDYYAAALLIFTKRTRLKMSPEGLDEILNWPPKRIEDELAYMARTIPSSWEFCNYTLMVEDVTRAFTHQLVRTRTASYAQQTMRMLDVSGFTYSTGPTVRSHTNREARYGRVMEYLNNEYEALIESGVKAEDARGILPTNIHTNIVVGANMRTVAEWLTKRVSPRTQGEYREFLDAMRSEILAVHPWARMFFDRTQNVAARELDEEIAALDVDDYTRTRMIKLVDELRKD